MQSAAIVMKKFRRMNESLRRMVYWSNESENENVEIETVMGMDLNLRPSVRRGIGFLPENFKDGNLVFLSTVGKRFSKQFLFSDRNQIISVSQLEQVTN